MIAKRLRAAKHGTSVDELALSLLSAEYNTLRTEIHQAMGYAQGIVRWSIGIFGVVLGAGLLAAEKLNEAGPYSFSATAALLLFGIAIPGVLWAAAWTWLGELIRLERAGAYLRGLESEVARVPGIASLLGFPPLRWERFIHAERTKKTIFGKQTGAYLGTAGVFFGATLISLTLFVSWWVLKFGMHPREGAVVWWLVAAAALELVGLAFAGALYTRLARLGKSVAFVVA